MTARATTACPISRLNGRREHVWTGGQYSQWAGCACGSMLCRFCDQEVQRPIFNHICPTEEFEIDDFKAPIDEGRTNREREE